ncbi:MAG: DNA repair protein RecN [Bacteroidales bacterium]|nr:DNA repair protein RecN [Bacteroidales bacterium]MBN2750286.1 DNA repair protein RecN [Bacteroidales bacterium]
MLKNLHIQNYALIDHLDIEFHAGLNIITGETGAGKSILLGALGLILGQRTDSNVLKDTTKSCVVEGLFDISAYNLKDFFTDNDLDYYDSTIIRRQINEAGKSRAFVNEVPVTLTVLKELGSKFIDIHSQHESLMLGTGHFQLNVLDSFAGIATNLTSYTSLYHKYRKAKDSLTALEQNLAKDKADFDYYNHQLQELNDAKLKAGEVQELEELQQKLTHAEEIKSALTLTYEALNGNEVAIVSVIRDAETALRRIEGFYPSAKQLAERLESARIELRDIAADAEAQNLSIDLDPGQLEQVSVRLDRVFMLLQKHRLTTADELITLRNEIDARVASVCNADYNIEQHRKELEQVRLKLVEAAEKLTIARAKAAPAMEKQVVGMLEELGIKFGNFKVDIRQSSEFHAWGTDMVQFLFSANKAMPLQDLSKTASGGELSRLMLSLKSLMAKSSNLPTIIFDEIDTGVSGEIADKMGRIINRMSTDMQVINITHLPQIASKGKHHYMVYKDHSTSVSATRIKELSADERIVEIAKMLSGETVTDAALSNAKALLSKE